MIQQGDREDRIEGKRAVASAERTAAGGRAATARGAASAGGRTGLRRPARRTRSHAKRGAEIREYYAALFSAYGPQDWWPGETPLEIAVGAVLTQNTNWKNVERAIENLRRAGRLDWDRLRRIPTGDLARLIRPAGYYNVKARRLKNFVRWLWERHGGDFEGLARLPLAALREELLAINGIGPETADSILLYALDRPTFVVDAYTMRIAQRHRLAARTEEATYEGLKSVFEKALPKDARVYNEYHALIVAVGKRHCRVRAQCQGCPLERFEHDADDSDGAA